MKSIALAKNSLSMALPVSIALHSLVRASVTFSMCWCSSDSMSVILCAIMHPPWYIFDSRYIIETYINTGRFLKVYHGRRLHHIQDNGFHRETLDTPDTPCHVQRQRHKALHRTEERRRRHNHEDTLTKA